MLVWLIVPFMIFAVFDPSPLTVCTNCSFFYIYSLFAVLLPDLSRLSCHSVQRMFLKINTRHQAHKPVKECNYWGPDFRNGMVKRVELCQRAKFRGDSFNRRRDMAIFRIFKMAAAPCWILIFFKFLTIGRLKRAELRRRAEFGQNRPNRGRAMAIFRFFKMAAAAILDFSNFIFLTVGRLKRAKLRRRDKFGRNRSKRG